MALTNLSSLISQIRDRRSWQGQNRFLKTLECWQEVVGEAVAKQSQPVGIYRRVLQVAVPGSVWAQALSFERKSILAKLNTKLSQELDLGDRVSDLDLLLDIHFSTAKWAKPTLEKSLRPTLKLKSQTLPSIPLPAPPNTPLEAFQRWQTTVKNQRSHLPKCPICSCPSAKEDLERWQMCRICVRQNFR
jgi:predicted nucleic acid-binding Zn ribbon protein